MMSKSLPCSPRNTNTVMETMNVVIDHMNNNYASSSSLSSDQLEFYMPSQGD